MALTANYISSDITVFTGNNSNTITQNITLAPAATISYTTPVCSNVVNATPTRTGTAGGTYSATPTGLSIAAKWSY